MGRGKDHAAEYRVLVGMLRELRKEVGLTQAELAERLGKPQSYVSKVSGANGSQIWWRFAGGAKRWDRDVTELIRKWDSRL